MTSLLKLSYNSSWTTAIRPSFSTHSMQRGRLFASTMDHNGLTVFMASVPRGTLFYHGTNQSEAVTTGIEYLAFEPELSRLFANGCKRPPLFSDDLPCLRKPGYFHTYRPTRDLSLLYLDGQAAAKTTAGAMDMQYRLFVGDIDYKMDESEQTRRICSTFKERGWDLDGILRMEMEFEIILCDFGLMRLEHVVEIPPRQTTAVLSDKKQEQEAKRMMGFNLVTSANARFNGFERGKLDIDFENFVSAFAHDEYDLYPNGSGLPRFTAPMEEDVERFRQDIDAAMERRRGNVKDGGALPYVDWQAITDRIVSRYAPRLKYLSSDELKSDAKRLRKHAELIVSYLGPMSPREHFMKRCMHQDLPLSTDYDTDSSAPRAILDVTRLICATLLDVATDQKLSLKQIRSRLKTLRGRLGWREWDICKGCQDDEICSTVAWPFGARGEEKRPMCRKVADILQRGYWDDTALPGRRGFRD